MALQRLPRTFPLARIQLTLEARGIKRPEIARLLQGAPVVAGHRLQLFDEALMGLPRAGLVVESWPAALGPVAALLVHALGVRPRGAHLHTFLDDYGRVVDLWIESERALMEWRPAPPTEAQARQIMRQPRVLPALRHYTDDEVVAILTVLDAEMLPSPAMAVDARPEARP